jgi:hypothetical protein
MPHFAPMANNEVYEARISDEGLAALRVMIGRSPQQLFSPALDVEDDYVMSTSLSIPTGDEGWLIIENTWLETPKDYADYYQLSITLSPTPKDIAVGSAEHIGKVLNFPVSSISISPPSPIVKITIHEETWSHPECTESVVYDRAIIFWHADGRTFSISTHDSIADLLDFTKNPDHVQSFTDTCPCRVTIE